MYYPFCPQRGKNQVVSPAAASASVTIDKGFKCVRLANAGTKICYARVGTGSQTATTADTPILPGTAEIFYKGLDEDTVAYISADGTTLHIQNGEGGI